MYILYTVKTGKRNNIYTIINENMLQLIRECKFHVNIILINVQRLRTVLAAMVAGECSKSQHHLYKKIKCINIKSTIFTNVENA